MPFPVIKIEKELISQLDFENLPANINESNVRLLSEDSLRVLIVYQERQRKRKAMMLPKKFNS